MAITQDEMQDIVSAIISAIRTNSRTIEQLTPVTSLSDNDSLEINGGKKVSVGVIKSLIESLATAEHDSIKLLISKQELSSFDVSATDTDVTLTVSSKSKTVSASLPIATTISAGVVKAADMVKLQSAYNKANEAETQLATLHSALEALRTRMTTAEGDIATNAGDIATLQDDLQRVADALNALSGAEDTTAVIDTFNEVVDFLAGITNDETLSAKLMELKNLIKKNADDIIQLQQVTDENRNLQNSQGSAINSLQTRVGELSNSLGELSQALVDYEDDAALALSEAEARLGRRIDAVGILPFNAIVEAHGSVSDGAPDYATQFPSTADGAYRHIIFDKSRGTFLWEIHTGDYPNCPAGDAYTSWKGSGEYVAEGLPRTDRLYRLGNELYRWKDGVLQSIEAPNGTLTLETGEASYDIPISVGTSVKKNKVGKYEDMVLTASVKNNELYLATSRPLADDEYATLLTCGAMRLTGGADRKTFSRYRWHIRRQYYPIDDGNRGCQFAIDTDGMWKCNGVSIRQRLVDLSGGEGDPSRVYYCHGKKKKLPVNGRPFTVTYGVAIYKKDATPPLKRKSNMVYFYIDYQLTSYDADTGEGVRIATIHL